MTPSARCAAFIQGYEKCRLVAFKPTPNDVWTLGWGATGPGIFEDVRWTQAEADARFVADLARFCAGVATDLGTAPTTQAQFDAMVSLAYNIGAENFSQSTVLRLHRLADYAGAANAFVMWNKQKGVVLDGLTTRRAAEAAMYRSAAPPAPRNLAAAADDLHGLL